MSGGVPRKYSDDELRAAVEQHGSFRAAGRALGITHSGIRERFGRLGKRTKRIPAEAPEPQATGQVHYRRAEPRALPPEGKVATYILTSAQLSTEVHAAFWKNLRAYEKWCRRDGPTEILVAQMTYDQRQYRRSDQVKARSKAAEGDAVWIADEVRPYLSDGRVKLAPTLQWCGELNILPTAVRPLTGLDGYTGRDSCIVPHTKLALESVATGRYEPTKFMYTTGACTLRNYVQKRAGQIAEFHHAYAALIVEVLADGRWFVRQLNATSDGNFQDLTRVVRDGKVTDGARVAGMVWGDIHASAMDHDVRLLCWGSWGPKLPRGAPVPVIDVLRPEHQFFNDLDDSHADSHHDRKSARKRFEAWLAGNSVAAEVLLTRHFLIHARRDFCESIVVPSNHDEHRDRWLDEADPRSDPHNSRLWHEANAAMRTALVKKQKWTFAAWQYSDLARVLDRDEPFVLHEIEITHGDLGPNGARGSTQSLLKTCRRLAKGHDHSATIRDGITSAGVCARTLAYARGYSSWSISHVPIYPNGKRCILTQNGNAYWAPRRRKNRSRK